MKKLIEDAKKITNLEIQGATNVALSATQFLYDYAKRISKECTTTKDYFEHLDKARKILTDTRDTEPAMRNGIKYIINKLKKKIESISLNEVVNYINDYKEEYKQLLENAKKKVAEIGAQRIPNIGEDRDNEFIIMTHCHSSFVNNILLEAKRIGKIKFKVIATETQPRLQGRETVKELLDAGIEVIHVVDSAMRWVVNHYEVDLILIGADSITSEGTVLNKIGSRLLALVAHEEHVPFYICTSLLKYNPETSFGFLEKIEMRDPKEIWKNPPEGLKILNPAFETVSRRYIDGLFSEAGIFASSHVHNYFSKLYPDLID